MMQRQLCPYVVANIANTDEVGALFRSYRCRCINPRDRPTATPEARDLVTAVLTVFVGGTKSPAREY